MRKMSRIMAIIYQMSAAGPPQGTGPLGERREATFGGILVPQGRPKALAPWGNGAKRRSGGS